MSRRNSVKLFQAKFRAGKHVCVGLDTDYEKMSSEVRQTLMREGGNFPPLFGMDTQLRVGFNRAIIDATKDIAACYKLNRAFYEGKEGLFILELTLRHLRKVAPRMPWIWDAKYGDVGNTGRMYAEYTFEGLGADAVTVSPYLGKEDGLDAFLGYKNKVVFVLCRTSNVGGGELQDMEVQEVALRDSQGRPRATFVEPLFSRVAKLASRTWNDNENCGLVVGATYPDELARVRLAVGDMPILVPGVGAQGGDLEEVVYAAIYTDLNTGKKTLPAVFNSSRGIIFASNGVDFREAARAKTRELNNAIKNIVKEEVSLT